MSTTSTNAGDKLTGLTPTVLYGLLLAFSCTALHGESKTQSEELQFALIGDMPYDAKQKKEFANVMKEISAADVAFVVHDGDFWGDGIVWKDKTKGLSPCSDETFQDRLSLAQSSRHPFIFVPGDRVIRVGCRSGKRK